MTSSVSRALRGMIIPMMNAPKMTAIPISSVMNAEIRTPAKIAATHPAGTRPTWSKAVDTRPIRGLTTTPMSRQNPTARAMVSTTSPKVPATAIVVASAIRNQAVTSSIAALASVSAPTGRLSMRRSTRMRASTGNAVMDIATPMNRANATNLMSGPRIL